MLPFFLAVFFLFFNATATTEIYTLSLHDALPILRSRPMTTTTSPSTSPISPDPTNGCRSATSRSEEHTSELQSLRHLVCRLLLEKKNKDYQNVSNLYMLREKPCLRAVTHKSHIPH